MKDEKLTYINGFDDPDIIAGQGTIGMEILADHPDVDAIVVPIGGGGLIAGVALAAKVRATPKMRPALALRCHALLPPHPLPLLHHCPLRALALADAQAISADHRRRAEELRVVERRAARGASNSH